MSKTHIKRNMFAAIEAMIIVVLLFAMYEWGVVRGKELGMKNAYSTNPVSEELEMVCAGLWVGEQIKKGTKHDSNRSAR